MSFYTNYQHSSGTLTVGSPLFSYLDVLLPGFLPHELTSGEARHQEPKRFRQGSLEPIHNDSADTVFQGRVVHIPVEALVAEAPVVETLTTLNLTIGMASTHLVK